MNRNQKLFRVIVVMGAAITAPACLFFGDDDCGKCLPQPTDARVDGVATSDARPVDAGVDTEGTPSDAPVDSIVIII